MDTERQLIYTCLDNELNENALFLSERLHAQYPTELIWTHLRSLSCLRLNQPALAAEYSRDEAMTGRHMGCSYVFALACLQTGKSVDGIVALKAAQSHSESQSTDGERFIPDTSAVQRLLGKLYIASGDVKSAALYLASSMESNPFMWDSFTVLCDTGIPLQLENIFRFSKESASNDRQSQRVRQRTAHDHSNAKHTSLRQKEETKSSIRATSKALAASKPNIPITDRTKTNRKRYPSNSIDLTAQVAKKRPHSRIQHTTQQTDPVQTTKNTLQSNKAKDQHPVTSNTTHRSTSVSVLSDPFASATNKAIKHPNTNTSSFSTLDSSNDHLNALLNIIKTLGTAYFHLSRYQPKECTHSLSLLPINQQATPWVLSKVGRAQYELMQYPEAKTTFQVLHSSSPSWIHDMEIYSTVLWHLKEDVELALLAHELTESHYLSPETWCTAGNSFSLQGDRVSAIKCFQRACSLTPRNAHSFSLLGFEHFEAEEYTESTKAFRNAIQVDNRHYSAWVGLGRVHEKLGRHSIALQYFLNAEKLNSHNAVLMIYIAKALGKEARYKQALVYLERGAALEPSKAISTLINIQTATIYLRFNKVEKALQSLSSVRDDAPDEPHVHFLLGQAYLKAGPGRRSDALRCFSTALSLTPGNEHAKVALAALQDSV